MKIGAGLVMLYGERSTKTNKKLEKSWQIPYSDLKNISGELEASLEAAKTAYMEGLDEITIYHDFEGVSNITCYNGDSSEISSYVEKMKDISSSLKINFVKVKSHSGDVLNNRADELAREAIGL
jgi:ribonuclease HI